MAFRFAAFATTLFLLLLSTASMFAQIGTLADDGTDARFAQRNNDVQNSRVMTGATISGVVQGGSRDSETLVRVELHDVANGATVASVLADERGGFVFHNVRQGTYELVALRGADEAREQVNVFAGEYEVTLRLWGGVAHERGTSVSVAQMKVPNKARNEFHKAQDRLDKNRFPEAREAALKAVQIYPDYAEAHALLGILDLQERKPSDATAELEKAVQLDPSSSYSFTALGATYNVLNRFDDAVRALSTALRLSPVSWQANFEIGKAYLGKGDFATSLRHLDRAMEAIATHDFLPLHLVRAYAFLGLKQYPKAIAELEHYVSHAPENATTMEARHKLVEMKAFAAENK
jgi:tetratricopeptide (TPR) repeat protein